MADLPIQRVSDRCSPQRPDETYHDYFVRWKVHRDAWRQQFLDDYYRPKETRLPSPDSDGDIDEDETLQTVRFIERCIRLENGRPEPSDLPNPVERPQVVYPPGKSLSEIDEYEPGPSSPILRCRPEDDEYDTEPSFQSPILDLNLQSVSMHKRSSLPDEDGGLEQPLAKRRRTDTNLVTLPAGPGTSVHKRKRVQDGNLDEPQVAREQARAGPKKRKTDTHSRPSLAGVTSCSKRKRVSGPDEAQEYEVQASQPGRRVLGAKRRRVDEETITNDAAGRRDRNHTRTARDKAIVTSSPRVTRARRRQLSGEDAQLFQLGQRGQLDLQEQACETQGQATEAAAGRPRRRRSPATINNNTRPKASHTSIGAKARTTTNSNTNTKSSAKSRAGKNATTIAGAGTKARRGRPKRQVPTNSGE